MNLGLEGRFEIVKHKALMRDAKPVLDVNGEQIISKNGVDIVRFNNLVTDTGLDMFNTEFKPFEYFYLSTDNTDPNIGDTSMVGVIGISSGSSVKGGKNTDNNQMWFEIQQVVRFGAGTATGNIAKIGTGASTNGLSKIFSVALIKDSSGASTVISKLPDEILDVTYKLRMYIQKTDVVGGVVSLGSDNYNVTIRPIIPNSWGGGSDPRAFCSINSLWGSGDTLQPINTFPAQPSNSVMTLDNKPYVLGSYRADFIFRAALNMCVYPDGLRCIGVSTGIGFLQIGISNQINSKGILKTLEQTLAMPPFTISWGRYVAT